MPEIDDGAAQIVVASPPFTYQRDSKSLDKKEYLNFLRRVFRECLRVLIPGGTLSTINTDLRDHARYNGGDKRFDGLLWQKHCAIRQMAESVGFRCVEAKIWAKSLNRNVYRYNFSYVQFFRKRTTTAQDSLRGGVTKEFGPDVWLLENGTLRRDLRGRMFRDAVHPEVVRRCLEQFSSRGDLVVSPFTGSGTIVSIARLMGRRCVGYETDKSLKSLIRETIEAPERFSAFLDLPCIAASRKAP